MFGYIRIYKPHLRICEYDTYKSIYCGLCKELSKRYGFVSRFTLSYDFTFLAMLENAISGTDFSIRKERCIAHPLKKTVCARQAGGLKYTSSAAILSLYHKLCDDIEDGGFKKRAIARTLRLFVKKGYKKVRIVYPELSQIIEEQMKNQSLLEKQKCMSLDRACEPTAKIMEAIAGGLSQDDEKKIILQKMGYYLGRYVYYCDAIEDLEKDFKNKNYNVLLLQKEITELNDSVKNEIVEMVIDTISLSLGELAENYVKLELSKYKDIIDNIIYLGLKNTLYQIINGKFVKEK